MGEYFRAIPLSDAARPDDAYAIAGGWTWFNQVEVLSRTAPPRVVAASEIAPAVREAITAPRARIAGLRMDRPQIMGILNVTPDSFSDGGEHNGPARALAHARRMADAGATLIDIGGESTRPGATMVPQEAEIARTAPVVAAVSNVIDVPVSIDTRKSAVARAALDGGAALVNDVSGFTFDPALAPMCRDAGVPVCVMHAQGDPMTMQDNPSYDDVCLDIYDFLSRQIEWLIELGLARDQIVIDPGIGFGKTVAHNLALLARISLFHSLGCPILLGASRKGFIRTITNAADPRGRSFGSAAVALQGLSQGVQIVRVHDVEDTRQSVLMWRAATTGEYHGA